MLRKTFIHVPGIGKTTEASLWKQGCSDWDAFLSGNGTFNTGQVDRGLVRSLIQESKDSLQSGVHQFFAKRLGQRESWRAYSDFKETCVYLDIETDGRAVTAIGLYNGTDFTCLLKGENLENFRDEISKYSMIVTFCGGAFDLPQLERAFRGLTFDQIHIDLCPLLRKLGMRGGLKKIEKDCGIIRPPELDGLTGFDAVVLWRRFYGLGDESSLEKLIAYNRADCVNLEVLAEIAFTKMEALTLSSDH